MKPRTITIAEIPDGWIEERREIVAREGHALRPAWLDRIEIKSLTTNRWLNLPLPNDASGFAEPHERDQVLNQLQGIKS